MTNLPQDHQNNLVSFLRHNQPLPPNASPLFEEQLFNALKPHNKRHKIRFKAAWTVPGAIATGFLFTSVSLGFKTPRIALEPKDIENFLVKNWHNTLENTSHTVAEDMPAEWLLPNIPESQPTLATSAQ